MECDTSVATCDTADIEQHGVYVYREQERGRTWKPQEAPQSRETLRGHAGCCVNYDWLKIGRDSAMSSFMMMHEPRKQTWRKKESLGILCQWRCGRPRNAEKDVTAKAKLLVIVGHCMGR